MILTGPAILSAYKRGAVVLDPFDASNLNPNSYNYHLADRLLVLPGRGARRERVVLPRRGYVLHPGRLYLGTTHERIGSDRFVTLLLGRSSIGRLGIFMNITADLGHVGSCSRWTLELTVLHPVRVYPHMKIGQVSFWVTDPVGPRLYAGRYHRDTRPVPNRDQRLVRRR